MTELDKNFHSEWEDLVHDFNWVKDTVKGLKTEIAKLAKLKKEGDWEGMAWKICDIFEVVDSLIQWATCLKEDLGRLDLLCHLKEVMKHANREKGV